METLVVNNFEDLEKVVAKVLSLAKERKADAAVVLALSGELGAGKTTFVQLLAKQLGVHDSVTSPTFVVMKKYETTDAVFSRLTHIDAYRIEDVDEMRPLRFAEECTQNDTIIAIEWAEKIKPLLPAHTISLTFTLAGDAREITIHGKED